MSERLIQEIADTMMRDMFAPHELPVDAELQAKYAALARKIAALPGVLPQDGLREALAKFFESFEGSWNGAAIASQVRNFVHAGSEPQDAWKQKAADWLEQKADLETNSLHCGDNSITIQTTHNFASALKRAAIALRAALSDKGPAK